MHEKVRWTIAPHHRPVGRSDSKVLPAKLIHELQDGLALPATSLARIGIDLVHIPRIEESLRKFGPRFTQRLFTEEEAAYATGAGEQQAQRLAARFAAKEACIKALSLSEAGVNWRDMEVMRAPDGSCTLRLHDRALQAAKALGITQVLVCLSHDGDYAAAVVAALSDKDEPQP